MKTITTVVRMQKLAIEARNSGKTVALVPTMGYLHDGHASLLHEGRRRADLLVLSIFVNPTQFCVGEDLDKYPRDMDRDAAVARKAGVDIIFAPRPEDMYPPGYQTWVDVDKLTRPLCGASRPGHFRGVTTVVTKLFGIVQPTVALFGMKDYQQLAIIRRMTADLNLPVEVVGMPIVREHDGLAMSSRNVYLSTGERQQALSLSRALSSVRDAYRAGVTDTARLTDLARQEIAAAGPAVIDYLEFRDGSTLDVQRQADDGTLVALAVRIGKTRLIDNCLLGDF